MFKNRYITLIIIALAGILIYAPLFGGSKKMLSQEEVKAAIEERFKDPKRVQIELKLAQLFTRIANGETNYDHLFKIYNLIDSCRYAVTEHSENFGASFTSDLIFRDKKSLKNYIKYNAHFSGRILSFPEDSEKNCGVNPNE